MDPLNNGTRCEFRDRGSIPSECQIPRDVDLGQVNFTISLAGILLDYSNTLLRSDKSGRFGINSILSFFPLKYHEKITAKGNKK